MRFSILALAVILFSPLQSSADSPNQLSPDEKAAGFQAPFNGKDLEGWEHGGQLDRRRWRDHVRRQGRIAGLRRCKIPDDFELFRVEGRTRQNSGVYYRPTQYEYQILDNAVHPMGRTRQPVPYRSTSASNRRSMRPNRSGSGTGSRGLQRDGDSTLAQRCQSHSPRLQGPEVEVQRGDASPTRRQSRGPAWREPQSAGSWRPGLVPQHLIRELSTDDPID